MKSIGFEALDLAKRIQNDAPKKYVPPSEGMAPKSQNVLPHALVKKHSGIYHQSCFSG